MAINGFAVVLNYRGTTQVRMSGTGITTSDTIKITQTNGNNGTNFKWDGIVTKVSSNGQIAFVEFTPQPGQLAPPLPLPPVPIPDEIMETAYISDGGDLINVTIDIEVGGTTTSDEAAVLDPP